MSAINIFLFFVGMSRVIVFNVGGQLILTDLVLTASFLVLIGKLPKVLRNGPVLLVVSLAALWLLNQIITDIYLGTPFDDWSRGWAKIVFFVSDFLGLLALTELKFRRISAYLIGIAFSYLIEPTFFPKEYFEGFEDAWKFAYGAGLASLAALLGTSVFVRRFFGAISEWLPLAVLAVVNLIMDFRSMYGIATVAVGFGLFKGAIDKRPQLRAKITPTIFVVCVGVGLAFSSAVVGIYSIAADNGWLGEDAKDKYLMQTSSDVPLLSAGRSEWLVSTRAIADSPIIGHGSWAKDAEYIALYLNILESRGFEPEGDFYQSLRIPTHSHLSGAWVEAGIMGGVFWFAMLGLAFKAIYATLKYEKNLGVFVSFMLFWFIWDVLFSPFGWDQRLMKSMQICIAVMVLERLGAGRSKDGEWLNERQTLVATGRKIGATSLNLFFGMTQAPFQAHFLTSLGLKKPGQVNRTCADIERQNGRAATSIDF